MKKILRIKINGVPVGKITQSENLDDFYFHYPRVNNGDVRILSHFSFHSKTGRITFKTTSFIQKNIEVLPSVLELLRNHPVYKGKVKREDLDLYGRSEIHFSEKTTFHPWFQFCLNMGGTTINKYFSRTKTKDSEFNEVWNIVTPPESDEKITVSFFIGQNISELPESVTKKYAETRTISLVNPAPNQYNIFLCWKFDFPSVKPKI